MVQIAAHRAGGQGRQRSLGSTPGSTPILLMSAPSGSPFPAVHDNHSSSVTDFSLQFDPLAGPLTKTGGMLVRGS